MDNLLDKHLSRFKGVIRDTEVEGIVFVERNKAYLFQNEKDGSIPDRTHPNDLGYKYSWCVIEGSPSALLCNGVENFELIEEEKTEDETPNQPQNTDKRKLLLLI